MADKTRYVVGADLGGTNVRAAVVEELSGDIAARSENVPSRAMDGADISAAQVAAAVEQAIALAGVDRSEIRGVGLAVPGHIRPSEGLVLWSTNFKDHWVNEPIAKMVSDLVHLPVFLGNDANLAALGEFTYGIGRGTRHLVMLTLGTGIGGGVIIEGRMLTGHDGGAAELGEMIVAAGVDARRGPAAFGSLESLAQRDAIVDRAARKLSLGRLSVLGDRNSGRGELSPKSIAVAAYDGDAIAMETMDETGYYLGLGVASCISVFNPQVVVIGGGIAQAGEILMKPIIRAARANTIPTLFATCRIEQSILADNAGILGAAALIEHEAYGLTKET